MRGTFVCEGDMIDYAYVVTHSLRFNVRVLFGHHIC